MDIDDDHVLRPSPEKVARRAIVLSVVACRGFTERDRTNPEAKALAEKASEWLSDIGLWDELTEWEAQVLAAPFGELQEKDEINASWLIEASVVMAWALRATDLPAYNEQCDPADAATSLGFMQSADQTVLANPRLRSQDELNEFNWFIYNVHWRIRDFTFNKRKYDFEDLAHKAWGEPVLKFGLTLLESDLAVQGMPLYKSNEVASRTLGSITRERHRASNWLVGYASGDFYEVTTDT
jgi:hypothetical protein